MYDLDKIQKYGKEWVKGDMHRFYFNSLHFAGLEISFYNTGNISSVSLNGNSLSNSDGRRIKATKFWYDCDSGEIHAKGPAPDSVVEAVKTALRVNEDVPA